MASGRNLEPVDRVIQVLSPATDALFALGHKPDVSRVVLGVKVLLQVREAFGLFGFFFRQLDQGQPLFLLDEVMPLHLVSFEKLVVLCRIRTLLLNGQSFLFLQAAKCYCHVPKSPKSLRAG